MSIDVAVTAHYKSLEGRVVIITGGGQGIGRGYAHHFAAQGAIPIIAELNGDNAVSVQREIKEKGFEALAIQTDVASMESVTTMVNQVIEKFGRIDILINNAAVFSRITMAPFWELPLDEWDSAMNVNVTGSYYCARAVVPTMRRAKWGRIVNVTTSMDTMIRRGWTPYGPSKGALEAQSACWSKDCEGSGVSVNVLVPGGPANTAMVPASSSPDREAMVQPEVMQAPIVWLMSDDSDGFNGNRLTGTGWDKTISGQAAAEKAAAPAAWPGAGQQSVWPDLQPT